MSLCLQARTSPSMTSVAARSNSRAAPPVRRKYNHVEPMSHRHPGAGSALGTRWHNHSGSRARRRRLREREGAGVRWYAPRRCGVRVMQHHVPATSCAGRKPKLGARMLHAPLRERRAQPDLTVTVAARTRVRAAFECPRLPVCMARRLPNGASKRKATTMKPMRSKLRLALTCATLIARAMEPATWRVSPF